MNPNEYQPVDELRPLRVYRSRAAKRLSAAIKANCDAYTTGSIDRQTWDAEQDRLWELADLHRVKGAVLAMVSPEWFGTR